MNNKTARPMEPELWTLSGSRLKLLAHQCTSCGELFFPRRKALHCAHCFKNNLDEVALGPEGKIVSFSKVIVPPSGGYYRGIVPYAYGCIDLPEGIRIKGLIAQDDIDHIKVGSEVELATEVLYESDEGLPIETFVFRLKVKAKK
jgi:uncharacterized OB-fold protein